MSSFLSYLILAAVLATGGVLVWGLIQMTRGKNDPETSNKLMRYRVLFQGAALALFAALFYFGR